MHKYTEGENNALNISGIILNSDRKMTECTILVIMTLLYIKCIIDSKLL